MSIPKGEFLKIRETHHEQVPQMFVSSDAVGHLQRVLVSLYVLNERRADEGRIGML